MLANSQPLVLPNPKPPDPPILYISQPTPVCQTIPSIVTLPPNVCTHCKEAFISARGVAIHKRSCSKLVSSAPPSVIQMVNSVHPRINYVAPQNLQHHNTISLKNWLDSNLDSCSLLNEAYDRIVHWRKNLFQIPKGSLGKSSSMN